MNEEPVWQIYLVLGGFTAFLAVLLWLVPRMWRRRYVTIERQLEYYIPGKALKWAIVRLLPFMSVVGAVGMAALWLSVWSPDGLLPKLLFLGALVTATVLGVVNTLFNRPKQIVPPWGRKDPGALAMWFRGAKVSERHRVDVHDVQPENPADYEPYFIAICDCGWVGAAQGTHDQAYRDATKHGGTRRPKTVRPIG